MEKDENFEKNLNSAEKVVMNELEYEESRYEHIQQKASLYIGFISLFISLLLTLHSGSLAAVNEKQIIVPLKYPLFVGIFFLFLSAIFSILVIKPQKFKRPNVTYKEKGLLVDKEMRKSEESYKAYILRNIVDIIFINAKQNDKSAKFLLAAVVLFLCGFSFVSITLILGLV